ncbi:MAG: MGMT family protein [Defluviitaleaceae bacterium]|nr:MGMT family protein [Defluviitaleaceae bacterium]
MPKKTWNEKLASSNGLPKIKNISDQPQAAARYGGENMLIAPPGEYDEIMKAVPYGRVTTSAEIRRFLAKKHGADFTCPLTAGIFINVAAHASEERGGGDETPYWRTLKNNGELNEKYPGGLEEQKARLEAEGQEVARKGKRYFVRDYEKKLFSL